MSKVTKNTAIHKIINAKAHNQKLVGRVSRESIVIAHLSNKLK